ncbi:PIN domain-containing protein [Alicycliphilus denitrificans]|uniref:PIN domain-containing protein n=1 Tax=Alicycliphilus denitrificans TaxID=179636 RepID=UPI00384FCA71
MRKNAGKHPPRHPEKSPQPPAPGLRGHLLIDWENVQPKGEELRALVPEGTDLWLFHGPQQKVDVASYQRVYGEGNVTLVPRSGAGRNALDFQLSYYIGYVSARQPQGRFVVVSNDTGYDPMLSHARELGFHARRCEFRKPAPVSQPAVAEPAVPAKEKAALKTPAKPADSSAKATRQDVQRLAQLLQGMEPWERPGRCDALRVLLQTHLSEPSPQSPRVAHALSQLQAQKRVALKSDAVSYPSGTAIPAPGLPPATATKKKTAVPTAAQIAQAVLASLEKMPKNKPARREGLLKLIETHAVKAADPKAMAQQVCALLEARKEVTRSPDGKGVAYPKIQKK